LNLTIFKIPTYSVSIAVTATASIGLFSGIFLLPLLIQEVYGMSEIMTGLLFLPSALLSGLFMTLGGKLLDLKGPKYVVPIGLLLLGSFTLARGFNSVSTSCWCLRVPRSSRGAGC